MDGRDAEDAFDECRHEDHRSMKKALAGIFGAVALVGVLAAVGNILEKPEETTEPVAQTQDLVPQ